MKFDKKYLIAIFPILVLGIFFIYFQDIVAYLVLGWVVSMIGAPLMRFFLKFFGRNSSAMLTLTSFLLVIALVMYLIVPRLLQQARNLTNVDYNKLIYSLEEPINDWNDWLVKRGLLEEIKTDSVEVVELPKEEKPLISVIPLDSLLAEKDTLNEYPDIAVVIQIDNTGHDNHLDVDPFVDSNKTFFDKVKENILEFINPSRIQAIFGTVIGFFGNIMIAFLSIIFVAFFFLREQGLFGQIVSTIAPTKFEAQSVHALDESSNLLIRYFIGVTVQISLITLFVSVFLSILGIKNALLIGFMAALMNVIPYIGPLLGAALAAIITISSNLEVGFYSTLLPMLFKVALVFVIMQLLDNFLLQPIIFGKSVKAHPLEIFVVVLMGAKMGGILGMVLAIPVYTILRVAAKVFMSEFKIVQQITKSI